MIILTVQIVSKWGEALEEGIKVDREWKVFKKQGIVVFLEA